MSFSIPPHVVAHLEEALSALSQDMRDNPDPRIKAAEDLRRMIADARQPILLATEPSRAPERVVNGVAHLPTLSRGAPRINTFRAEVEKFIHQSGGQARRTEIEKYLVETGFYTDEAKAKSQTSPNLYVWRQVFATDGAGTFRIRQDQPAEPKPLWDGKIQWPPEGVVTSSAQAETGAGDPGSSQPLF
jgi:hypothetical protein